MNPYQFFLKHAGYSYDPATQSPMQGRVQCARRLAAAERKARDAGISFQWEQEDYFDSSDWVPAGEDGSRGNNPWKTWFCAALAPSVNGAKPEDIARLGGIDFGRDGEPWGNPHRRVVEAELALEALDNLEVQQ